MSVVQKSSQRELQHLGSPLQTQACTLASLQPAAFEAWQQSGWQLPHDSASTSCTHTMSQPLWQHDGSWAHTQSSTGFVAQPAAGCASQQAPPGCVLGMLGAVPPAVFIPAAPEASAALPA